MDWTTLFDKRMAEELPEVQVLHDEPMSRHTSFRIGGPARRMACPASGEQLASVVQLAKECGVEKTLVIGKGTNLLTADEGLDYLVITTAAAMHGITLGEDGRITADAGVSLVRLAEFACRNGLAGLEFAHGIPGTLGGAVCMNAGAYGGEMVQVLESVTALFPEGIRTLTAEEAQLSYRHSLFSDHPEAVVLSATVKLTAGEEADIRARMQDLMGRRKSTQPLEYPSAGSTFKRPTGYFAGTLIDQTGLKGLTVGGAQVSEKHAGFVINIGGATFADVTELMRKVQEAVFEAHGVRLEPEVRIIR